ncbi:deleted in malignant brain tumors 1 protein-like [Triplophysa dalaica]|uniref:deleted in malignant brain tumors 1 protein-like n=1 Tax=Triplophysa dalaica TaxID=1582913 RepID=UPI0024E00DB0|nr:deleted in malignant brain tumors 1 protein-like [Triplophysa dalaica]
MGFGTPKTETTGAFFGQGVGPVWLDDVKSPVRLVNGSDSCSGRVEVLYNGTWGTVCMDVWDELDAAVVCREMGCPSHADAKRFSYFGSDLKLADTTSECSGRVEVLDNNEWGTVCDAGWDLTDAGVVCKNMGCGSPVEATIGAYFGQGSGSVFLEDVDCTGNEISVTQCPSNGLRTSSCTNRDDAGVICQEVKLVDGISPCDGRLQVLYTGHWGSVCHTGWGLEDAMVLCRELGCGEVLEVTSYVGPYDGPKWMDNVACRGKEATLRSCGFSGWDVRSCVGERYAGVVCNNIKLAEGEHICAGRVEVLHNFKWGTVCDVGWDLTDAGVVCKNLGCGTPWEAKSEAFFGKGSGTVLMEDLTCTGKELTVKDCPSKAIGTSSCNHKQDAGVICRDIKVVNGTSTCDGRLQVLYDQQWGTVCYNGWDVNDATVLCSELGCGEFAVPVPYKGPFVGPIWMDNVACTGKEWLLKDCSFTRGAVSSCANGLHAGVVCIRFVRKNVVRITVTVDYEIDVNDPDIKKSILDEINTVVKSRGNYFAIWKTQLDGSVFQKIES